jgi:hypothetical protein
MLTNIWKNETYFLFSKLFPYVWYVKKSLNAALKTGWQNFVLDVICRDLKKHLKYFKPYWNMSGTSFEKFCLLVHPVSPVWGLSNVSIQILKMWRPVIAGLLGYLMWFPTQVSNMKDPPFTRSSTTGINIPKILLTSKW